MSERRILEENLSKTCRICFDSGKQTDLIRPCLCSGGSAYVHRECLDNWRSMNKEDRGFKYCEVCQFEYVIEPVIDDPEADQKRLLKFRLLVARDIILILLLIQAIIIGLAFLIQLCDSSTGDLRREFPDWMSTFGVYYLCSLIIFLAILGIFGFIGLCMGWTTRIHRHEHDPCNCYDINCLICCYSCPRGGGGDCHGDCGKCDGQGVLVLLVVVVVFFAIIGLFIGIFLSIVIVQNIMQRHTRKLWLKQQAKKYVVKDFEGKLDELRNIRAQPIRTQFGISENTMRPSAPVEVLSENEVQFTKKY